jgi:predicted O-methyltransferase YrrM
MKTDHFAHQYASRLSLPGLAIALLIAMSGFSNGTNAEGALDSRVQNFLDEHVGDWRDMNVPYEDGKILHDIIIEHGFTRAVEIGTSTGHSTTWIAWALSKTGGQLTTVEIDERRYNQARENIAAAGLADYVEFMLGDAHEIVPALDGLYDFVFSDADKDWYIKYFDEMYPKLTDNACFVAHNVEESRFRFGRNWETDYLAHVRDVSDMRTILHPNARNGVAVTCKNANLTTRGY